MDKPFWPAFFDRLGANLADPDWYADNILNYLIFTATVAGLVWLVEYLIERRRRAGYEGWTLHVLGFGGGPDVQPLWRDDVERFRHSDFELWKFVKSVVSGTMQVRLNRAEPALREGWLIVDAENKRIVIDFSRVPDAHVKTWFERPGGAAPGPRDDPEDGGGVL